jgi:hypothetical protein
MLCYRVLWLAVLCIVPPTGHADLYRWLDGEGNVHYTDSLPPSAARQVERIRLPKSPVGDSDLPYALQQATKNFPVTLFVTDCGQGCTAAREFLVKRGVPHTELDARDGAVQTELKKVNGGTVEVPVLLVGKQVVRGFDVAQWNGALDTAGYPKTALVKVTPYKPPPAAARPDATDTPASTEGAESER